MNGRAGMEAAAQWDDLRKQARKLEGELDVKLSSYRRGPNGRGDEQAKGDEAEIETLLQQLQTVNDKMQAWVSTAGSDVLSHTLARHQNIFHELAQEFRRITSTAKASRDHAELLQTFTRTSEDRRNNYAAVDVDSSQQSLLREQVSIYRNTAQVDYVIGQAQAAFSALSMQRSMFDDIGGKINSVGTKFTSVSSVLTAIKRKKSKDTIIISAVVAICTVLLIILWLSK